MSAFATARFQTTASPQQSKALTANKRSAVVISASGMATGGRVLHHLAAALPDPRNTVLFAGFQAEGTRGRQLIEGATDVKIHGRVVPVRARIEKVNSMSAHADRGEILRWLRAMPAPPVTPVPGARRAGTDGRPEGLVRDRLGWDAHTPGHGETVPV